MKLVQRVIYTFLFLLGCGFATAGDFVQAKVEIKAEQKIASINQLDSVVFDLSKADTSTNQISFPVYILSDDTVNALDFSFKYNETNFAYDSILEVANYLQTFSFYNPFDSTLRFTSNSFQRYQNDTALVLVRFTILSGQFCTPDIRNAKAYLNGDGCSVKIVDCLHVDVSKIKTSSEQIKIFPNPTSDVLRIWAPFDATMEWIRMDGSKLIQSNLKNNQVSEIQTATLPNGVYLIHVFSEKFSSVTKISVQH